MISLLKTCSNGKTTKNRCFVCVVRPIIYFGCICVTAIEASCPHSRKPVPVQFKISSIFVILSVCMYVSMIYYTYDNFCILLSSSSQDQALDAFSDILTGIAVLLLYLVSFLRLRAKIRQLTELQLILEDGLKQQKEFLTDKFVSSCYNFNTGCTVASILFLGIYFQITFISQDGTSDFKTIFMDICFCTGVTVTWHYALMNWIFHQIFVELHKDIKTILTLYQMFRRRNSNGKLDLESKIKWTQRIYIATYKNLCDSMRIISPAFLVWFLTILIASVVCDYRLLVIWQNGEALTFHTIFRTVKAYGFLIAIIYTIGYFQKLANVVRSIFQNSCISLYLC